MNKLFITASALGFMLLNTGVFAQEAESPGKKETEELIIRKKGEKDIKLTIESKKGETLINGKPLDEFKDDEVTINKRKIIIGDDDDEMIFSLGPGGKKFHLNEDFIKQFKEESRPFLGVTTETDKEGVKITEIIEGSAAEKAGLKKDDIIMMIDDKKIDDPEALSDEIRSKEPKKEIKVSYKRNGKKNSMKVVLGEHKERKAFAFSFTPPDPPEPPIPPANLEDLEDMGHHFEMDFPRHQKIGLKIQDTEEGGNVKVIGVEDSSAAEKAGIKKGDLIIEIDGRKINNTDDAREQLHPDATKSSYNVKVKRGGSDMSFNLKIPKKLKTANL